MKPIKRWKKLRYWQKGLIIGFLLSFLPWLEGVIDKFYIVNDLFLELPRDISYRFLNCDWCIVETIILNLVQFLIGGLIIGLTIDLIKIYRPKSTNRKLPPKD